jgi:glycosyltransferase involved in cell wall biosynthesis
MHSSIYPSYVLITPARNEEAFLEKTIQSVISQSILPAKWIIVSDGSTDNTDSIAMKYSEEYGWMDFKRMPEHNDRHFAAKAHCFNTGYQSIKTIAFEIIGNLDADLSFEPDYFEYLLSKFAAYPGLGVAGTPFVQDMDVRYDYRFTNIEHVSGACQLFRRDCFESIGGYTPIKSGGIDWVAVTTARMRGWETKTFTGKTIYHHRKMGTGKGNTISAAYRLGRQDYDLGNHPLWELLRAVYQMRFKPYVLGGSALFAGFFLASIRRAKRPISHELQSFSRKEQKERLISKILPSKKRISKLEKRKENDINFGKMKK